MLFGGLALLLSAVSICIAKQINIEVEANWIRSPFQLDVIEAIASENATAYYPLLAAYIGINEIKGKMDDKTAYETLVQHAIEAELVSEDAVPYVDWKLALHEPSALIQAYYQYYKTSIEPKLTGECDNVLYYGGELSCDMDSVFALKTVSGEDVVEILPTDRVFGSNIQAPVAILYADIASESFPSFHSHLVASAMSGKIQYIVRYKPSEEIAEKEGLSGYGVELALKRTDYLVIDDRNTETKEESSEEEEDIENQGAAKPIKNLQVKQDAPISAKDLSSLGYKAAGYIINNEGDKFEALANASLDFPKYSYAISQLPPDGLVFQDVKQNSLEGIFHPGYNSLLINGAPLLPSEGDIFKVSQVVERERKLAEDLAQEFDISKPKAHGLITKNYVGEASGIDHITRYDYRNLGLIWLNDVERDAQYQSFPKDVQMFLKEISGEFYPIRHNANSIVLAVDLSNRAHLNMLAQAWSIINRGLPVQVGIIPLTNSREAKERATELHYLEQNKSFTALSMYLVQLIKQEKNAFALALGATKKPDLAKDVDIQVIVQDTQAWIERFDIDKNEAVLFVNGVILDPTVQWLPQASAVMSADKKSLQKIVSDQSIVVDSITPLRDHLLMGAQSSRNRDITPPDEDSIKYMDTTHLVNTFDGVPNITVNEEQQGAMMTWWYFGDFADELTLNHTIELGKHAASCDSGLQLNIIPIVDAQKADTSIRQVRRRNIVNALQFLHHFKGKNGAAKAKALSKVAEVLYDQHYGSKKAELDSAMQRRTSLSSTLEPEFSHDNTLSVGYSEKLGEYWGLQVGSKLIAAGRIVKLTKPVAAAEFATLHLMETPRVVSVLEGFKSIGLESSIAVMDKFVTKYTKTFHMDSEDGFFLSTSASRIVTMDWAGEHSTIITGEEEDKAELRITAVIDPLSEKGQFYVTVLQALKELPGAHIKVFLAPDHGLKEMPLKRFYRSCFPMRPDFDSDGRRAHERVVYEDLNPETLYNVEVHNPSAWIVTPEISKYDLENIILRDIQDESLDAVYELRSILLEGHGRDITLNRPPQGLALELGTNVEPHKMDTIVMANLGYMQFQANPGLWQLSVKEGRSDEVFELVSAGVSGFDTVDENSSNRIWLSSLGGKTIYPRFKRKKGMEKASVLAEDDSGPSFFKKLKSGRSNQKKKEHADINIFSVASGHLYERFLSIMTASVMKHTDHTVKFWLIEQFLSPSFREFLPALANEYGFEYELVTYKWPHWLRGQSEKQRTIWGYKILFLDVLFPQSLENVIFVDADQIVRTDLKELVDMDLHGAPYGYTPMGDSREEMEGFRFWKKGYWKNFLEDGKYKYHISALYVVDLDRFRRMGAGDRLRQQYQGLSADPNSLSNLDQDLPNNLQKELPIFSLPKEWLWCETWSADEELKTAKTIDLCNNPLTKEPKLARARRQLPEWTVYDDEVAELHRRFDEDKLLQLHAAREQKVLKPSKSGKPEVALDHDEL